MPEIRITIKLAIRYRRFHLRTNLSASDNVLKRITCMAKSRMRRSQSITQENGQRKHRLEEDTSAAAKYYVVPRYYVAS